jgi:NAD(P)H-dependent FMN reductase
MENKIKIGIIIGSTRPQRFSEKPAQWIFEKANKKDGVQTELLDLRDYPMPFYEESAPIGMLNGNYASEIGKKWADKVKEFDAYVIITPEYNHAYPAVLKNALDYALSEWADKPVNFISYGYSANGARAVAHLQPTVIHLGMIALPNPLVLPNFWTMTDKDGKFNSESVEENGDKLLDNLIRYAKLLKGTRTNA